MSCADCATVCVCVLNNAPRVLAKIFIHSTHVHTAVKWTISNREKWIRKQSAIQNFLVPHKRRSVPTTLSGDTQNALGCDCMKAEHIRSRSPLIMIKSLLNHNRHLASAECVISFGKSFTRSSCYKQKWQSPLTASQRKSPSGIAAAWERNSINLSLHFCFL